MQEALAYFIVFCAAVICVRRYAPRFAKRLQIGVHDAVIRLRGGRPPERPAENTNITVQRISADALKRTLPGAKR